MTLILIVSDLEFFRVQCPGADHARGAGLVIDLGADLPLMCQIPVQGMSLTQVTLPQRMLGRRFDKHGPPVDLCKLDKFYSSRKRIDAPEEKLVLQAPTVQMYFRELLGHGKLDKDSVKKLRLKYYMGDKGYKALAPPTLSNTKLHMIQTHEAGGVYNRFLGIHIHHRDSLKLFLRGYELLGGCGDVFAEFEPVHP